MARITNLATAHTLVLQGKGIAKPYIGLASGATTNAAAASGYLAGAIIANGIGTTLPGTLQSIPTPVGVTTPLRTLAHFHSHSAATKGWFGIFYKLGTLNLAATGDQFTHDAATFPILRTVYGVSSTPIGLTPLIQITTATTTTAPIFTLKTGAGGAGYVNAIGSNIVGTRTFTCPNVATATNSTYHLILEDGDGAVRDITQINVGTAGATGAATIWGFEKLFPTGQLLVNISQMQDTITGGVWLPDITPGVSTAGTATTFFGAMAMDNGSRREDGFILGALDT